MEDKKSNFIIFILSFFKIETPSFSQVFFNEDINVFFDRNYFNKKNNIFLKGWILIQQERHNKKQILIETIDKIAIIRATCDKNNNNEYLNWDKLKIEVYIEGQTCIHKKLYYKEFLNNKIFLPSGGPISSDPIFIKLLTKDSKITIVKRYFIEFK